MSEEMYVLQPKDICWREDPSEVYRRHGISYWIVNSTGKWLTMEWCVAEEKARRCACKHKLDIIKSIGKPPRFARLEGWIIRGKLQWEIAKKRMYKPGANNTKEYKNENIDDPKSFPPKGNTGNIEMIQSDLLWVMNKSIFVVPDSQTKRVETKNYHNESNYWWRRK